VLDKLLRMIPEVDKDAAMRRPATLLASVEVDAVICEAKKAVPKRLEPFCISAI
jgi:hypothetical protein